MVRDGLRARKDAPRAVARALHAKETAPKPATTSPVAMMAAASADSSTPTAAAA